MCKIKIITKKKFYKKNFFYFWLFFIVFQFSLEFFYHFFFLHQRTAHLRNNFLVPFLQFPVFFLKLFLLIDLFLHNFQSVLLNLNSIVLYYLNNIKNLN